MFTLSDISTAHAQVKSGADFPQYVRDLADIGVTGYDIFVSSGHAEYFGNPTVLISPPKYAPLEIAREVDKDHFIERLRLHQWGGTDYMTFCRDCAECGVEKWTLDMKMATCTYYDKNGEILIVEHFGE